MIACLLGLAVNLSHFDQKVIRKDGTGDKGTGYIYIYDISQIISA